MQLLYHIYGILKEYQAVWDLFLTFHQEYLKSIIFASYIVLDAGDTDLSFKQILSEQEYAAAYEKWGSAFRVGMGAESIKELLHNIDLDKDSAELKAELKDASGQKKQESLRDLKLLRHSGNQEISLNG